MSTATQVTQLPAHIFTYKGKLINREVSEQNLDELRWYAQIERFDREGECQSRYGVNSGWLTYSQWKEIFSEILFQRQEKFNAEPKHYHHCPDGRVSRVSIDRHCEDRHTPGDIDEECRECRERMNRFFRRYSR